MINRRWFMKQSGTPDTVVLITTQTCKTSMTTQGQDSPH